MEMFYFIEMHKSCILAVFNFVAGIHSFFFFLVNPAQFYLNNIWAQGKQSQPIFMAVFMSDLIN